MEQFLAEIDRTSTFTRALHVTLLFEVKITRMLSENSGLEGVLWFKVSLSFCGVFDCVNGFAIYYIKHY